MPPCGSDLLLTWHVTRPFSARCFVPHRPHGYRLGLSDHALAHPSCSHPAGTSGELLYHWWVHSGAAT
ncbi:unnamed protein product [Staurois parvus]|uniref:Uncharacterized protein n=1 Tax=Staurois parvus TaxID=386267 RepID=A0ABN9GFR7_9NEOB|nr:unnamed protein product [Staurois parvus]